MNSFIAAVESSVNIARDKHRINFCLFVGTAYFYSPSSVFVHEIPNAAILQHFFATYFSHINDASGT